MRESTSWNQANGSTPDRLQEAIKLRNTGCRLAAAIAAEESPVCRGPARYRGWPVPWRRYQSPTRRSPEKRVSASH